MDVKQFLRAVLPSEGYYLVASYNAKNPKANEEHVVNTIDEMVAVANDIDSRGKDVFYALGTLDKQGIKVQKLNKSDGSMYEAIEKRTKANIRYISVLFIEVDVEPSGLKKGKPCYATQQEALVDTKEFCKSVGLPKPTVVNSGGGLHVYWRMDGNVLPDDQARLTTLLRVLVTNEMPKVADVGVMTDYARVLRVPETHNYKQELPRPVTVLTLGASHPYELYEAALEDRATALNLRTNKQKSLSLPSHLANVENNIGLQFDDIPPLRPSKVLSTCQQIKWAAENPNDVSEPLWVSCIRVLQKCENSDDVIHEFSKGYSGYSEAETSAKIIHIKNNYPSPVSCATIEAERYGGCDKCPHQGKGSSPAWLSRDIAVAPPPTMQIVTEIDGAEVSQEVQILNPPEPYLRTMDGKIIMQYDRADGETDVINVSPYDMYPTTRREDVGVDEYTAWKIHIPLKGWVTVDIPASTLIDTSKLNTLLLKNSVYLPPLQREHTFKFMIAYIQHIQTQVKSEKHYATLGWHEDRAMFVLNEKTITAQGVSVAPIGKNVIEKHIGTKGTFEDWKYEMNFYGIKGYEDRQFAIGCGFASVLFEFTQFKGLVINLDGEPGTGKTSLQWAANSIWGHPEELMGNGGKGGATAVGLFGRLARHKNILLCLDEISTKENDEMGVFIHSIAQGQGKLRHKDWGDPETWKTPVMTSSNGSVFHKISQAKVNSAGEAARLFEIYIEPSDLRSKKEADLFKRNIVNNYGHAGIKFVEFVLANRQKVEELIHAKIAEVDEKSNASSGERYRTGLVALVWVAMMICKKAGILDWDVEGIVKFGIDHVTSLRGITDNYKSTPVDVMSDFLDTLRPNILVMTGVNNSKHMGAGEILFMPIQKLLGRHELDLNEIYVNRKAFQDYCGLIRADYKAIEFALLKEGILKKIDAQKSLGANTYLDKSVTRCWIIDLNHPMLTGKAEDLQMVMQHQAQAAHIMQPTV